MQVNPSGCISILGVKKQNTWPIIPLILPWGNIFMTIAPFINRSSHFTVPGFKSVSCCQVEVFWVKVSYAFSCSSEDCFSQTEAGSGEQPWKCTTDNWSSLSLISVRNPNSQERCRKRHGVIINSQPASQPLQHSCIHLRERRRDGKERWRNRQLLCLLTQSVNKSVNKWHLL